MVRWPVLLALVLLGGCIDTHAGPADEGAAGAERLSVPAFDGTSGPLVAGEPVVVDLDGFARAWFCAPSGLDSCIGSDLPTDRLGPDGLRLERDGVASWHVELEMQWDATSDVTRSLLVYAGPYATCPGQDCIQVLDRALNATGPSPLRITGDTLVRESSADGFVIGVQSDQAWPVGVGGYSTGQAFRLHATLTPFTPGPASS